MKDKSCDAVKVRIQFPQDGGCMTAVTDLMLLLLPTFTSLLQLHRNLLWRWPSSVSLWIRKTRTVPSLVSIHTNYAMTSTITIFTVDMWWSI